MLLCEVPKIEGILLLISLITFSSGVLASNPSTDHDSAASFYLFLSLAILPCCFSSSKMNSFVIQSYSGRAIWPNDKHCK